MNFQKMPGPNGTFTYDYVRIGGWDSGKFSTNIVSCFIRETSWIKKFQYEEFAPVFCLKWNLYDITCKVAHDYPCFHIFVWVGNPLDPPFAGNLTVDDNRIFWPNKGVKLGAAMVESVCSKPCPKGEVKVLLELRTLLLCHILTICITLTSTFYMILTVF